MKLLSINAITRIMKQVCPNAQVGAGVPPLFRDAAFEILLDLCGRAWSYVDVSPHRSAHKVGRNPNQPKPCSPPHPTPHHRTAPHRIQTLHNPTEPTPRPSLFPSTFPVFQLPPPSQPLHCPPTRSGPPGHLAAHPPARPPNPTPPRAPHSNHPATGTGGVAPWRRISTN